MSATEESIITPTSSNTARMGGMLDETETFPWHHDIASKPASIIIYPYRAGSDIQGELLGKLEEANATNQAHMSLSSKEAGLKAQLLAFDDDEFLSEKEVEEKLEVVQGLERVRCKMKELDGLPRTGNQVIADWFCNIIKSHNLVDPNLQPIPLTREGYLSIEPTKFQKLYEDLTSFLTSGRSKKKRI